MQPARAPHALVIALLAAACAPSRSRASGLGWTAAPPGAAPTHRSRPDGGARPRRSMPPPGRPAGDAAFRAPDAGPCPRRRGGAIDTRAPADAGVEAPGRSRPRSWWSARSCRSATDDQQLQAAAGGQRADGAAGRGQRAGRPWPAARAWWSSPAPAWATTSPADTPRCPSRCSASSRPCWPPMRLTGNGDSAQGNATGTQITITAASTPSRPGRPGPSPSRRRRRTSAGACRPRRAARIATVAGMANRYAIFAYERGRHAGRHAGDAGAPARRAGLFIHTMVSERLTPAGWQIFDAAVSWTLGR